MCYDIKTSLEKQLRRAILDGNADQIKEINEKLSIFSPDEIELNHASGFSHPKMIIYTNENPTKPEIAMWGLIPKFAKSKDQQEAIWNKTLNAHGETIFEKPSFKNSAQNQRCLVFLEGFYEHYHNRGKTYPYFIHLKNKEMFSVAGLWTDFVDTETGELTKSFSLVTTKANKEMAEIHNNPTLAEPRMPLILPEEIQEKWLIEIEDVNDQKLIKELIKPFPDNELVSYTVGPIKGKGANGNTDKASKEVVYKSLKSKQGSLF
jgi:putative SOS response-associated peptidase YedK